MVVVLGSNTSAVLVRVLLEGFEHVDFIQRLLALVLIADNFKGELLIILLVKVDARA